MKSFKLFTASTILFLSTILLPLTGMAAENPGVPAEGVTQGDFAMWLVDAAGLQGQLPPAALNSDAINLLSNLGIAPKDGWDADKKLTRDDILEMLGVSKDQAAKLSEKSWEELIEMLVENVINVASQVSTTASSSSVSPSVSPGGSR